MPKEKRVTGRGNDEMEKKERLRSDAISLTLARVFSREKERKNKAEHRRRIKHAGEIRSTSAFSSDLNANGSFPFARSSIDIPGPLGERERGDVSASAPP